MDMIFPTPWAINGELEEIPDLEQSNGSVSFEIGFGSDYQKDITSDINAKNIERKKLNYLFNLMCNKMNALGEMVSAQGGGYPDRSPVPVSFRNPT